MNKIPKKRDEFLDVFKGFLILGVIHIHTVTFSGTYYIPDVFLEVSLLVIDVNIFFFISGYLTKPSMNLISSVKKASKQFFRLYLQYFFINCFHLFGLVLIIWLLQNHISINDIKNSVISMLKLRPENYLWTFVEVHGASIWYIRNYLVLLIFAPIVLYLINFRIIRFITLLLPLIVFCLASYLQFNNIYSFPNPVFFTSFYLFVYLLGIFYRIAEPRIKIHHLIVSSIFVLILCLLMFTLDNYNLFVQEYKFPPSLPYMIYSFLPIHIFIITKFFWLNPKRKYIRKLISFLEWCGQKVYYIYLFQGVFVQYHTTLLRAY